MADEVIDVNEDTSFVVSLVQEIVSSPLNILLLVVCIFLVYKIFKSNDGSTSGAPSTTPSLPKMKRQDINLEQLKQYDGTGAEERVCIGVNGKVFDVTRGKKFYGPGGPYCAFAGHDATRALATFSVKDVKEEVDDISDLSSMQMDSVREWEMQFTEKYDYVGKLLRPGEEPTEYSDEEDTKDKENKPKKED